VIPDILFPSLFDNEKIGESALEDALPWDAIRPANYRATAEIKKALPALRQQHQQRAADNPDFLFMREQKNLIAELREQTRVSLHEKIREQERKANDQKRLQLENNRRKAKGMKLLSSVEELDAEAEADMAAADAHAADTAEDEAETAAGDGKKAKDDDAMLTEAGHILVDYLKLNSRSLTAQRQP